MPTTRPPGRRPARRTLALAAAVLLCACERVPTLRIPQMEQAVQAGHGGGERVRAHGRCVEATTGTEALLRCMDAEGYHFVARSPAFPGPECWAYRDDPAAGVPPPHCFEHAPDAPH
jgi:hypothetical protein